MASRLRATNSACASVRGAAAMSSRGVGSARLAAMLMSVTCGTVKRGRKRLSVSEGSRTRLRKTKNQTKFIYFRQEKEELGGVLKPFFGQD
jgi:hypothetical protein